MFNPFNLSGRHYLVTGASSGIGREICVTLAGLGASVLAVARNEERLRKLMGELGENGHSYAIVDMDNPETLPEQLLSLSRARGKLNGIVHAAGLRVSDPLRMFDLKAYDRMWSINVRAAFMLAKGFESRQVRTESDASVVWISSIAALTGDSAISGYASTKGALIAGARALAVEWARRAIRINCIAPGCIKGPMLEGMIASLGPNAYSDLESQHLLGLGVPSDVANACAFLLSDASRWITGTTLVVDGGYSAR